MEDVIKMFNDMGFPNDKSRTQFLNRLCLEFNYSKKQSKPIVSNTSNTQEICQI